MLPKFLYILLLPLSVWANEHPHTFSQVDSVKMTHIHLDLKADFKTKTLSGIAQLTFKYIKPIESIILDTRALTINSVRADCKDKTPLSFKMGKEDKILGTPLIISNPNQCPQISINYKTSPQASGLQWLDKELTADKKYPFLFTQSEAIHGRSWIPMQDTPAIRVTYDATIYTPKALRAVMSAKNDPESPLSGVFHFNMPQAIPPYLIALAIGDLHYHSWVKRSGVYAEPALLEAAAKEFEDTPAMISATEKLYGPYPWQQYDLLILPPSFPFGGMENPRVSFITPTVIAGDKSLTSLISHELAHSWSGNLVTNGRWADIWLNEGITSYIENRIIESVYSRSLAKMEQVLSYQALQKDLAELDKKDQSLVLPLEGRDPDDAFTDVPYNKGALLMFYLEDKFGRQHLDNFLKGYFKQFSFKTITSPKFLNYLDEHLLKTYPKVGITSKNIRKWLYQPALPNDAVIPTSQRLQKVAEDIKKWNKTLSINSFSPKNWSYQEWVYFLNNIKQQLDVNSLAKLDKKYHLTQTGNAEIALAWFPIVIKNHYQAGYSAIEHHLISIGRRRLILPLYKLLAKDPILRDWGYQVFQKARPGYHPLAQGSVDKIFAKK